MTYYLTNNIHESWPDRFGVDVNELSLFTGCGGGLLGSLLLGWKTVCGVEIDSYARRVLFARQRDGVLPRFPVWDDVKTFDGRPWRGYVDVVSGGFPCQDISIAGRGKGIKGKRSGLWTEFARIISEVQPSFVWVENSPMLVRRGIDVVLGDLSCLGYDAVWGIVSAENAGAPHQRKRVWILAYADSPWELQQKRVVKKKRRWTCDGSVQKTDAGLWWKEDPADIPDSDFKHVDAAGFDTGFLSVTKETEVRESGEGFVKPRLGRVADGVPCRVDRLKCIGNGQVPAVVELAWKTLIMKMVTGGGINNKVL